MLCGLIAAGIAAAATGPVSKRGAAASEAGVSGEYRCGPGDRLEIDVFEVEELSGEAVVAADGSIRLPLIGAVDAGGLTPSQLEVRLRALYGENLLRDPQIRVSVIEYSSQPVSVLGAVNSPGIYQLRGRRRLLDVLALAGGLSPQVGETITVSAAGGDPERSIAVKPLLAERTPELNVWVEPHDTVQVETASLVYVLGAVGRPGGFPLENQERLSALQALSLAEGAERTAALKRARVIRSLGDQRLELQINLKRVLAGKDEDPVLEPKDILFVPNSGAKSAWSRGAEAVIQMATGVVIWRR